jgi:hypothetical protein
MLLNLQEDSSSYNIKGHYVTMRRSLVYGTIRFRHNGEVHEHNGISSDPYEACFSLIHR